MSVSVCCVWCIVCCVCVCVCVCECVSLLDYCFALITNNHRGYCRPEETWNLGGSVLPNAQLRRTSSGLSFDCCSAEDIAVTLCAIDYKLFRRVPVRVRGSGLCVFN